MNPLNTKQSEDFQELVYLQEKLTHSAISYWKNYSHLGTWQFWVILLMLVGPLVILVFTINRKNIFHICFFGFSVHVLFAYTDIFGIRYGLWGYPYQVIPFLPSISIDAALIPITIMFVYQWTLLNKKNYYLYAFLTALFFGFIFKPLLSLHKLFIKFEWVNYIYIFAIYIILFLLAYFMTEAFLWLQKSNKFKIKHKE